ncbi:unnamed protein product [Linum tenue]|uniref:Uncharacterized protein n=1 Tax=Linum tenue TaxID=586396 RepID=A0AAV0NR19_9ROSI|nr:unnamed protein product [Linum tenue]
MALRAATILSSTCSLHKEKLSQGGEAAKSSGIPMQNYTVMHLDLASLDSVKQFAENVWRLEKPNDVLVCNVVVYLPTNKEPTYTADRFELSVGTLATFFSPGSFSMT